MNFLKRASSPRTIYLVAVSLCILLAFAMARNTTSNASLRKPSVELQASKTVITYPCPPNSISLSGGCPTTADFQVALTVVTKGFDKKSVYVYTVSGGRVVGEGDKVTWDLSDAAPGYYAATVDVQDTKKHHAASTVSLTIHNCGDCAVSDFPCPTAQVVCYDQVKEGIPMTCKVVVGQSTRPPTAYEWSARDSNGDVSERISRQGIYISVRTDGLGGQTVFVTVKLIGLDPSCPSTASGSTVVKP